ncbi:hypothetical protein SUGI_0592390 [Cryptomeria japonica]|uniref:lachrymatory-factor synthase n=1 Tax=Cryptomeria japonica TaxID=3369 RepID=UPI0024148937|nr:lachrymatory-factor synthase [Cryptomeria japonica]XP_059063183.1 lachrymatory-factor synthase-like [Cryptomeria japonica]GLJ29964.1 hypothetical protein SUGI_0592340 [Cryptomeria japonica]GLJ29966.1 hypothetical protein SUGI_0592390 [Cryptomeria japonica]
MASSKLQGSVETKVMAPLEVVWKIASDFYELHKWFPGMKSCERVEGAPEKGVGSLRRCITSGQEGSDSFGVEELIAVDDTNHSYTYSMTDTNIPGFNGYQATIEVCEAKEQGNCLLKWSFELDPAAGHSKEDIEALFSSILPGIAKNLEQLASSQ